jgi:hypothetical protein
MATVRADGRVTSHRFFAIRTLTNDSRTWRRRKTSSTEALYRRRGRCRCGRHARTRTSLIRDDESNDEGGKEEEQTEEIEGDPIVALVPRDGRRDEREAEQEDKPQEEDAC